MKTRFVLHVPALLVFCLLLPANIKVVAAVTNDAVSSAIAIWSSNYTNIESTTNATSIGDPAPGCVAGFGNGVWYQFTPDANGQLVVDTVGSDFDTGLGIYINSDSSLTLIACDDDGGGNSTSRVTTTLTAGMTYLILAGGYGGAAGNLVFHLAFTSTAPPASLKVQMQAGVAALTINGSAKASYEIQYSTNLNAVGAWTTLIGIALPTNSYVINDSSATNRPTTFYRSVLRAPAVRPPRIGWVDFQRDAFGDYASILRTNQPFLLNNDVIMAIWAVDGTGTHFTFGPTPSDPVSDIVPTPGPSVGDSSPPYQDGLHPNEIPASVIAPQPDVIIKAVSFQAGRLDSSVTTTRFRFKAADPVIQGTNATNFTVTNQTAGALMWFTTDGSDPTNSSPSVGPIISGSNLSLTSSNFTFKIRAFKFNYTPSDVVSKSF